MEKINLYLDDIRSCPEGYKLARTIEEAKYYLENYDIGVLSLDHDLGLDEKGELRETGYDLVKYFCQEGMRADVIKFHTANPVGRENMVQTLLNAQYRGFIDSKIIILNI